MLGPQWGARGGRHYTYSNWLFVTLAIPVLQKASHTELFFKLNANANYSLSTGYSVQINSTEQQHSQKKDVHLSETLKYPQKHFDFDGLITKQSKKLII